MRQAVNVAIIGDKGTGKTTVALDLARRKYESEQRNAYVLTRSLDGQLGELEELQLSEVTHDNDGIYKVSDDEIQSDQISVIANTILKHFRKEEIVNCSIILDDASSLVPSRENRLAYDLVNNTRHLSIDFIFIYHRFDQIATWLLGHISYLLMFKSTYNMREQKKLNDYPDPAAIIRAHDQVMASTNRHDFSVIKM